MLKRFVCSLVLAVAACPVMAQDAVKVSPQINQVLVDNAHIRVVKSTFAPGQKEATHSHPAGWYIVTQGGDLLVTPAAGKASHWLAKTGEQAWMEPESAHTAQNVGHGTFEYILVEVKGAGGHK